MIGKANKEFQEIMLNDRNIYVLPHKREEDSCDISARRYGGTCYFIQGRRESNAITIITVTTTTIITMYFQKKKTKQQQQQQQQ